MRHGRSLRAGIWTGICLAVVLTAAMAQAATKPSGKKGDLVVLDHERWIDSLKGTIKNFSRASAQDVTILVKFLDKKKQVLGTQKIEVGDLRAGEATAWSLSINRENRPATSYQFEIYAIWR